MLWVLGRLREQVKVCFEGRPGDGGTLLHGCVLRAGQVRGAPFCVGVF